MRVVVLVLSIFLILTVIFVAEYFIVEEFFDDLRSGAENMKKSVLNGEIREEDASDIVEMWEKHKGKLYVFEDHEYFKTIEESVYNLSFSAQKGEQRNILYALEKIIVLSDEAEYDFALTLGNVF